jgi:hypothetical protein
MSERMGNHVTKTLKTARSPIGVILLPIRREILPAKKKGKASTLQTQPWS